MGNSSSNRRNVTAVKSGPFGRTKSKSCSSLDKEIQNNFFFEHPKIRQKIYSLVDPPSLLTLRSTCSLFLSDIDKWNVLPFLTIDLEDKINLAFVSRISSRGLLIKSQINDIKIIDSLRAPHLITKLIIRGPIEISLFSYLLRKCEIIKNLVLDFNEEVATEFEKSSRDYEFHVPTLKYLEIQADKMNTLKGIDAGLKSVAIFLQGLEAPKLTGFQLKASYCLLEEDQLGTAYSNIILPWVNFKGNNLEDFRVSITAAKDESFVQLDKCIKEGVDSEVEVFWKQMGSIAEFWGVKDEGSWPQVSTLKIICDFIPQDNLNGWKSFFGSQKKLKFFLMGFSRPIKWEQFEEPIVASELTLQFIDLHNLTVYDEDSTFTPLDLKMFSGCVILKSLRLSLSIFQTQLRGEREESEIIGMSSLPSSLEEFLISRFTVRGNQLLFLTENLPKLKILTMKFTIRPNSQVVGLNSTIFLKIWKRKGSSIRMISIRDFAIDIEPLVHVVLEDFREKKKDAQADKLSSRYKFAKIDSDYFTFDVHTHFISNINAE